MKKNTKNVNIILVDDDIEDCMYFEEALGEVHANYIFKSFNSGEAALSYLSQNDTIIPDILFLDLNMPGTTGKECLKEIRKMDKCSNMPIAIYSTSDSDEDKQDTLASGANIYIRKTNSYIGLKASIEKVLNLNWQYHYLNLSIRTYVMAI